MAAPSPRPTSSLEDLPNEIQQMIMSRIPCRFALASMSAACSAWRDVVRRHLAPPPALPWLLLPTGRPDGSARVACVLCGCHDHHSLAMPGARCFGSHDGAWLFLHYGPARAHVLSNFRRPRAHLLPSGLLRWNSLDVHAMFMLAAALSSSPDEPGCIGAAIVAAWRDPASVTPSAWKPPQIDRCVAFWVMGWALAEEIRPNVSRSVNDAEDVVYHDRAFRFLLPSGNILASRMTTHHGQTYIKGWKKVFRVDVSGLYGDQYVHARYLVVSRGELLMVARFKRDRHQPTSKFKVFRMTKRTNPDDNFPWSWSKLDTLGGRMLFVGYGCSRSYEVDQYPAGFKEGVYFLDDGRFYDEPMLFNNYDLRPYPCNDNGMWSEEGQVQRCFPRPHPSSHSAPAWILP